MLTRRFRDDRSGLAAVEFALILPVMVTLFFGIVELSQALSARADVANMASVAADLVAQESTVTPADMQNVYDAARTVLYPFNAAPLTVTVYSIVDDGKQGTGGKVAWSCTCSGATGACANGPTGVPTDGYGASGGQTTGGAIIAATNIDSKTKQTAYGGSGSVIIAKVDYAYSSSTTRMFTGDIKMSNVFYSKPRRVAQIPAPTSCSS